MGIDKRYNDKGIECCSLLDNMYEVAVKMKDLNVGAIPILMRKDLLV